MFRSAITSRSEKPQPTAPFVDPRSTNASEAQGSTAPQAKPSREGALEESIAKVITFK